MTDEHTETESQSGPDGFVIVHVPKDKSIIPYGIGPFPPIKKLADAITESSICGCKTSVMWVQFPPGIRLMVDATGDSTVAKALAMLTMSEDIAAAVFVAGESKPEGPVH